MGRIGKEDNKGWKRLGREMKEDRKRGSVAVMTVMQLESPCL